MIYCSGLWSIWAPRYSSRTFPLERSRDSYQGKLLLLASSFLMNFKMPILYSCQLAPFCFQAGGRSHAHVPAIWMTAVMQWEVPMSFWSSLIFKLLQLVNTQHFQINNSQDLISDRYTYLIPSIIILRVNKISIYF